MLLVMSLPTPNVIGVGHVPISTRILARYCMVFTELELAFLIRGNWATSFLFVMHFRPFKRKNQASVSYIHILQHWTRFPLNIESFVAIRECETPMNYFTTSTSENESLLLKILQMLM